LATTGPKRLAIVPDVPSTSEFASGLEAVNWYGMVVPAGTPREAILRFEQLSFDPQEVSKKVQQFGRKHFLENMKKTIASHYTTKAGRRMKFGKKFL
jgi:tripartite-type tricarboxylate transporter receptor subunit TctC